MHSMDGNDFQICLDRWHANDLLRFAFLNSPSAISPQLSLQTVRVDPSHPNHHKGTRYANHLGNTNNTMCASAPSLLEAVLDLYVVIDLCRPHVFLKHTIGISNGDRRSHSNLPNDNNPGISRLLPQPNGNPWRPHCPSDPAMNGTDFVVIFNTSQHLHVQFLEGVAVEADGPVAIRVDLHERPSSANAPTPNEWTPVADGAVLRPCRSSPLYFRDGQVRSVQIFKFSPEYSSFDARITFVECDGGPVRVGLIMALADANMNNNTAVEDKRTETFEESGQRVCIRGPPRPAHTLTHSFTHSHGQLMVPSAKVAMSHCSNTLQHAPPST